MNNRLRDDTGSMTAFAAATLGLLLLIFSFVIDVHGQLQIAARAQALANEAARAALTAIDTRGTVPKVDRAAALAAAHDYLAAAGSPGAVTITGDDTVRVVVTIDEPAVLGLLGARYRATGTADARLHTGAVNA